MKNKIIIFLLFAFALVQSDIVKILPYPKEISHGSQILEISRCAFNFPNQDRINPEFARLLSIHRDLILGNQKLCNNFAQTKTFNIDIISLGEYKAKCDSEAYELEITLESAKIVAECPVGLIRAISTLHQLIQKVELTENMEYVPEKIMIENLPIKIKDSPRFSHRGFMIDTSRHFLHVETIKRIIVGMMHAKLNALHWHLVDDDSFPMQALHVPGLAEASAFSKDEIYTAAEIKSISEYAKDHGVKIIPEIDCPGHIHAVGNFKPLNDLVTCYGSVWPYRHPDYFKIHGGPGTAALDPSMDRSYEFMENLAKDLLDYFKDDLIHLGGDEVFFSCWKARKNIEEFMKNHNIPDYQHLMNYFIDRVRGIIRKLDPTKKTVYWSNEETFDIKYGDGDIVQFWGSSANIKKLDNLYPKNKFILSPWEYLYLDCGVGNKYGGPMWCKNYKTWLQLYEFEPTNYGLDESKILGAEGCAWAELMDDSNVELKLWPRMAALSETLWLPKRTTEIDLIGLVKRMNAFKQTLNTAGIPCNSVSSQWCEIHPDICFKKVTSEN